MLGSLVLTAAACGLETSGIGPHDTTSELPDADGLVDAPPDLPEPDDGPPDPEDGPPEDAPREDAPEADTGPACGNGVAEDGEACDGPDLRLASCEDLGRLPGALACTPDCMYDLSGCPPPTTCGNDVHDAGEECDGPDLAGRTCVDLGFGGGDLSCAAGCTFDTSDCTPGCTHACAVVDERRCVGTTVERCVTSTDGCRSWLFERDCAADTMICSASVGSVTCLGGTGDSCDAPQVVGTLPFNLAGGDLTSVFHNHLDFRDGSCAVASGAEVVFARWMAAGETVRLRETGTLDVVLRVLAECSDVGRCLAGRNEPENPGLTFTAPADGNYFFIVEAFLATPAARGYNITLEDAPDGELCTDPLVAEPLPLTRSGGDIAAVFTDDYRFTGPGCTSADGVEAVIARSMAAGETVRLRETGTLDAVLRVLDRCDATARCLVSRDGPEDPGLAFTAPAAGTYYFVVEAKLAFPSTRGYSFTLEEAPDGDVCGDPLPAAVLPATLTAGDFHARFTDDVRFTGSGCSPADGAEAFFARAMTAGETVRIRETGALDVTLRVLGSCDPAAPCLADRAEPDNPGLSFTAPADGTYYFVVEAYLAAPPSRGYAMTVDDPPAGNLCGDPLLVTALPFTWSGADLAVDYTDDVRFTGTSCTLADGPELIFRLDALAGEQIVLSESGTLDAVLRVLEDCTPTAPCLYSQDAPENPAFTFVAPHDGSYFFVVESLNAYPATRGYNVRLSHP